MLSGPQLNQEREGGFPEGQLAEAGLETSLASSVPAGVVFAFRLGVLTQNTFEPAPFLVPPL